MAIEWLRLAAIGWLAAAAIGLIGRGRRVARLLLAAGCVCGVVAGAVSHLLAPAPGCVDFGLGGAPPCAALDGAGAWLLGFGLLAALPACLLATPAAGAWRGWTVGAASTLLGALGVFALRDAISLLVAWELMSLGGALMLLAEARVTGAPREGGGGVLFMLALLEVGSVALIAAFLVLGHAAGSMALDDFARGAGLLSPAAAWGVGLLLLIGFGAKLGVLPFYEWLPGAYGSGSGATGTLLSGVVLNAAFYALGHAFTAWLAPTGAAFGLGVLLIVAGVLSALLAVLFAFQEEDWRELLALSTAENACVAIAALGASLLFASGGEPELAGLAWLVALLHLAQHPLAKGALLLAADGARGAQGDYRLAQRGLLRRAPWPLGVGSVLAGMSLAAMPPVAGFVSEWYLFQTVFQGFHLASLSARLVLALSGAALAVTAAVAFATFVKLLGLGLQGDGNGKRSRIGWSTALAVGALGAGVLVLAIALPWLAPHLHDAAAVYAATAAERLRAGWLMVPLSDHFAFVSPTKLVIAGPLLALLPIGCLLLARAWKTRPVPVWYGGLPRAGARVATTALTFSNAMRTFYSFVYRPTLDVEHEHHGQAQYFLKRLSFTPAVTPLFGPLLFVPAVACVQGLAYGLRVLQSGRMTSYLALPGLALVAILVIAII
ncbi:MAG: hydrogenase 4 subunit B [Gammaproteobacteria bacterium]|nr:hydrogenase 4 subunit B [Gammaproteobacteria bacterium]